jgi:restriction system protein
MDCALGLALGGAVTDEAFHYPADLMSLLMAAVPLLCRSKDDVLLFFRGAGVPEEVLQDLRAQLRADRAGVSKRALAGAVLTRLNEGGDRHLAVRREVIRRVVEFEDFSACWPDDQLRAKGFVAEIRAAVNRHDSFTRMRQEREAERAARLAIQRAEAAAEREHERQLREIAADLAALVSERDPHRRGLALESVLNRLFAIEGIAVREAFSISDDDGVVEQVDGLIDLDGELYLVEVKWWSEPLGVDPVTRHISRLFLRGDARGILVSASGYTAPAIRNARQALTQKTLVLVELSEVVRALELRRSVRALLREKVIAAIADGNPLLRPLE